MGTQGHRTNYREAFACANNQLQLIYDEYHQLQARGEQLHQALAALQPFLQSAPVSRFEEVHQPEPAYMEEIAPEPEPIAEPVMYSAPVEPLRQPVMSEPVIAPSYAPVSDNSLDPIQARINRALGLAVA